MSARTYRGHTLRAGLPVGEGSPLKDGVIDLSLLPAAMQDASIEAIKASFTDPFRGLTTDGRLVEGLFPLADGRPAADGGSEAAGAVEAAEAFLAGLDEEGAVAARRGLDAVERRVWTNAFPFWEPWGVCLERLDADQRDAAMRLVASCLSPRGFEQARRVMKLNEAEGELVDAERDTLREWMYWLTIFGEPSGAEPWGWQVMGHHLVLNCFIRGDQMVLSPTFLGAEPNVVDDGPFAGLREFDLERERGLDLVRSLGPTQLEETVLYPSMLSKDLPPRLKDRSDGRHRGGAGKDNIVLPYEGIPAARLSGPQRRALSEVIDVYLSRLPERHAAAWSAEVERHLDQTHFCWIGPQEDDLALYYKVHSPVIWIEFDNHAGVFLDNDEPESFHVHTIVRTPNGHDYGMELLRRHRQWARSADRQAA